MFTHRAHVGDGAAVSVQAQDDPLAIVTRDHGIQPGQHLRQLAQQRPVARGQELVEHLARVGGVGHVALVAPIHAVAQVAHRRRLEVLTAGGQALAIDIHHQVMPGGQDVPEAAVATDGLMEVVVHGRGLLGGDAIEPAMDSPLVGEASAQSGLESGVRPQDAVARADALEAGGQAGQQGGDAVFRAIGGTASGRRYFSPGLFSHPVVGQAEDVGVVEDAFGHDDTEAIAGPWYGWG